MRAASRTRTQGGRSGAWIQCLWCECLLMPSPSSVSSVEHWRGRKGDPTSSSWFESASVGCGGRGREMESRCRIGAPTTFGYMADASGPNLFRMARQTSIGQHRMYSIAKLVGLEVEGVMQESIQERLKSLVEFFEDGGDNSNDNGLKVKGHVTDFYVKEMWSCIPQEWRELFDRLSEEESMEFISRISDPRSVLDFLGKEGLQSLLMLLVLLLTP
eukprot:766546-Hanusia_phi.AAC.1